MISRIRQLVYRLGFRPQLGSIFHSPTLHVMYTFGQVMDYIKEGYDRAMAVYFENDYEDDKKALEMMLKDKGLPTGIVTNIHHVPITNMGSPEQIMAEVEAYMNNDWFEEASHKTKENKDKFFFCPRCGAPLDFSLDFLVYTCDEHGSYEIRIGVNKGIGEIVVKSIRLPDGR